MCSGKVLPLRVREASGGHAADVSGQVRQTKCDYRDQTTDQTKDQTTDQTTEDQTTDQTVPPPTPDSTSNRDWLLTFKRGS